MERGNGVGFCMGPRFVNSDHDPPLLLPPNLRDWVPSDHLSHFILDAVDELDLRQVRVNTRGTGSEQYLPSMLLSLLLFSYATGVFSSRRIERSTYESVLARMIAGDSHPDHDTLCAFRRNNLALINESFVRVLEMAAELKVLKVGQITVARMRHRMKTQKGREKYKLRQQTVEPVFGIIKSLLGFRRFMLSGLGEVKLEWTLVSTADNLKRLHRMVGTV